MDRHELEQHRLTSTNVNCTICHKVVQRRALQSHLRSKRHRNAQQQARKTLQLNVTADIALQGSQMLDNEATIEPRLVTSLMFYKLNAYGSSMHSAFWDDGPLEPSVEVLKLRGQALRSIARLFKQQPLPQNDELIAPVAMIAVIEWMLGEWEQAQPHLKLLDSLSGIDSAFEQMKWIPAEDIAPPTTVSDSTKKEWSNRVNRLAHVIQESETERKRSTNLPEQHGIYGEAQPSPIHEFGPELAASEKSAPIAAGIPVGPTSKPESTPHALSFQNDERSRDPKPSAEQLRVWIRPQQMSANYAWLRGPTANGACEIKFCSRCGADQSKREPAVSAFSTPAKIEGRLGHCWQCKRRLVRGELGLATKFCSHCGARKENRTDDRSRIHAAGRREAYNSTCDCSGCGSDLTDSKEIQLPTGGYTASRGSWSRVGRLADDDYYESYRSYWNDSDTKSIWHSQSTVRSPTSYISATSYTSSPQSSLHSSHSDIRSGDSLYDLVQRERRGRKDMTGQRCHARRHDSEGQSRDDEKDKGDDNLAAHLAG